MPLRSPQLVVFVFLFLSLSITRMVAGQSSRFPSSTQQQDVVSFQNIDQSESIISKSNNRPISNVIHSWLIECVAVYCGSNNDCSPGETCTKMCLWFHPNPQFIGCKILCAKSAAATVNAPFARQQPQSRTSLPPSSRPDVSQHHFPPYAYCIDAIINVDISKKAFCVDDGTDIASWKPRISIRLQWHWPAATAVTIVRINKSSFGTWPG